jgi:hypothetical protein
MKENSRIRFNPITKEIEVEGSELFVKSYFDKLQTMISRSQAKTAAIKSKPNTVKVVQKKVAKKAKVAKVGPARNASNAAKKKPNEKKVTNIEKVITLIKGSKEGITTVELKQKTGLAENQIWNIVNRATQEGKVRKMKRGLYLGPTETRAQKIQ